MVTTYALTVGAALLLCVSIYVPALWFTAIVGIAIALYQFRSLRHENVRTIFLQGALFGSVYIGGTIAWAWNTLPLDWLGLANPLLGIGLVATYWCTAAVLTGSVFGLFSFGIARLSTDSWFDVFFIASLWTIVQYLQMWWFSLITIGPGSLIGAHFSPFLIGYALAWSPALLQLASVGGIYILTFVISLFAATVVILFQGSIRVRLYSSVGMLFLFLLLILIGNEIDTRDQGNTVTDQNIHIAFLATNLPPRITTEIDRQRIAHERDAHIRSWALTHTPPDLFITPEATQLFASGTSAAAYLADVFNGNTRFIDSSPALTEHGRVVRLFTYSLHGSLAGTYDKMFLMPQGEYMPFLYQFVPRIFGGSNFAHSVETMHALARGTSAHHIFADGIRLGVLFCGDMLSPQLYRSVTRDGAEILINIASQSIFHNSYLLATQTRAVAKVRAVENGRYFLLVSNASPSVIISDLGSETIYQSDDEMAVFEASAVLRNHTTWYVRFGDMVLLLPSAIVAVYVLRSRWSRRVSAVANASH